VSQGQGLQSSLSIAVVGDVHEQWGRGDELALMHLGVDLVLFVGDFGNEAVSIVQQVSALPIPKAIVLGNHDAWYTATPWGRERCPYQRPEEDWFQQQLDCLGELHIGYRTLEATPHALSIVGGRPFSWGGPDWKFADFYAEYFGVSSMADSRDRIIQAMQSSASDTLIVLNHNGPFGLGDQPEDPCGRDWQPRGGDYGDPDLTEAIAWAKANGKKIPLVAFGHMHHQLRHTRSRLRTRLYVDAAGTVYLNAACVPREKEMGRTTGHNFSLVTLEQGQVRQVRSVWVTELGEILTEELLYSVDAPVEEPVLSAFALQRETL
jgi:uncharacterized protein (TIGR04168 family)